MHPIRRICSKLAVAGLCALVSTAAWSQDWPGRPIRVIVPYPPGAFSDTVTRIVVEGVAKRMGKTIIVENKGGANGMLGVSEVSRATPDGYTFGTIIPAYVVSQHLYNKIPFDPENLVGVASLGSTPLVLSARKDAPFSTVEELVAYAKANPGRITFGSSGIGSSAHLNSVVFQRLTDTKMMHVPYKGSVAAKKDLMSGEIDILFDTPLSLASPGKEGQIKLLGVVSDQRMPLMPDVPTLSEQGIDTDSMTGSWVAMLAPKGTPPAILDRMASEIGAVVKDPAVVDRLEKLGVFPMYKNVADFNAFLKKEDVLWGRMVRDANVPKE